MTVFRMLVLIGSGMLILGARLPWISVPVLFGVEGQGYEALAIGWEDNGYVTGGTGLLLLLAGMLWRKGMAVRYAIFGSLLLAGLSALVVTGCFYRILEMGPEAGFFAATDIGIYVTLGGSLVALGGAVGALIVTLRSPQGPASRPGLSA